MRGKVTFMANSPLLRPAKRRRLLTLELKSKTSTRRTIISHPVSQAAWANYKLNSTRVKKNSSSESCSGWGWRQKMLVRRKEQKTLPTRAAYHSTKTPLTSTPSLTYHPATHACTPIMWLMSSNAAFPSATPRWKISVGYLRAKSRPATITTFRSTLSARQATNHPASSQEKSLRGVRKKGTMSRALMKNCSIRAVRVVYRPASSSMRRISVSGARSCQRSLSSPIATSKSPSWSKTTTKLRSLASQMCSWTTLMGRRHPAGKTTLKVVRWKKPNFRRSSSSSIGRTCSKNSCIMRPI